MKHSLTFDVAIIGSGIAGSVLGAVLARQGMKVVIFEAKSHPRFSIGESLILETSETMRALADLYDVPELAYFSSENFAAFYGTTHGVKRHFGFLHHTPGQPHDKQRTLQAIIPKEPHGHELHLYRQDTDYFMMTTAVSYGAAVLQNTPVQDIALHPDRVEVITTKGAVYTAEYVVDAGGYKSLLADKFNLRDHHLRTQSRALFTHMVNVPDYHQVGGLQAAYGLPFRMSEGTLHHVFDGGWLWVIPFDNHETSSNPLCSVGLLLDPRRHPLPADQSPEEEFFSFIERFPTVAVQFKGAQAVRDWTRTGRIQYTAKQVVGDRWALLGHAVGFIDPLYSKGLYGSLTAVSLLAHLLLQAKQSGDYSAAAFMPLEKVSCAFIRSADRLIANSFKSFGNYKLWQVYAVQWLMGAYTEYLRLNMIRAQAGTNRDAYYQRLVELKLVGGGFAEFDTLAEQVDSLIEAVDVTDETAVDETIAAIHAIYAGVDWMPEPFRALLRGKTYLPKNKIRLSLLNPQTGFMGSGAYRAHFFEDMSLLELARFGAREKIRYAAPVLAWQQRQQYRHRTG
ncbi:MAG: tryptophan 7-halogenase [Ardenticatenaceae bacterium]|nr:tryptophan 7-halogenase [Ardenticatenaceae bacterium]